MSAPVYSGVLAGREFLCRPEEPWVQPCILDLSSTSDQVAVQELLAAGQITRIHDPIEEISDAVLAIRNPSEADDETKRREHLEAVRSQGEAYGRWVHYSWNGVLAHYPGQADYQSLRVWREREIVTQEEQDILFGKRVMVIGQSVGRKVLSQLVEDGIGGSFIYGDPDTLDITNLNRIKEGYDHVGLPKTDLAAKEISLKDPWLEQFPLPAGLRLADVDRIIELKPDIIIDEVDSMSAKALIRKIASEIGAPVLMGADIGDRTVVDVERYDTDSPDKIAFNGAINWEQTLAIAERPVSEAENKQLMLKHLGVRYLSVPVMQSVTMVGTELGGLPQTGMTATKGGAKVAYAAREVLLGGGISSGRYADNPRKMFGQGRQSTVREFVAAASAVKRYVRAQALAT